MSDGKQRNGAEKPISLHPLTFDQAVERMLATPAPPKRRPKERPAIKPSAKRKSRASKS